MKRQTVEFQLAKLMITGHASSDYGAPEVHVSKLIEAKFARPELAYQLAILNDLITKAALRRGAHTVVIRPGESKAKNNFSTADAFVSGDRDVTVRLPKSTVLLRQKKHSGNEPLHLLHHVAPRSVFRAVSFNVCQDDSDTRHVLTFALGLKADKPHVVITSYSPFATEIGHRLARVFRKAGRKELRLEFQPVVNVVRVKEKMQGTR